MIEPFLANVNLPSTETGILGSITALVVTTFTWMVKAARSDLRENQREFTSYLKTTAAAQTEALIKATATLQIVTESLLRHEENAERRQSELKRAIEQVRQ